MKEKSNFVVYEKIITSINRTVYIGMGSIDRANQKYRSSDEFNKLVDAGLISTKIIHKNLTEGEAKRIETVLINKKYDKKHLFNKNCGTIGYEDDTLDEKDVKTTYKTTIDKFIDVVKMSSVGFTIKDRATPSSIGTEIIDTILNSKGFSIENKKFLNPNARSGELFKQISDRVGIDMLKNNFTMVEKDDVKCCVFNLSDNINGAKMQDILVINEDFNTWNTNEKYDVIVMNPPFVKYGEKFIIKCMGLLKKGGFLGCVMSPTWRSVSSITGNQNKKAYTRMTKEGGFHYIHMYSATDTTKAFNQPIGQVDVFVWQKGIKIDNTEIINLNGDKFYYDLTNYPQTPPVLPSYIYDKLFDQVNGLKWDKFNHLRDKNNMYGKANILFYDVVTKKVVVCNQKNIEKSNGKKLMIDQSFLNYYIDDVGDIISNQCFVYHYNTVKENIKLENCMKIIFREKYNLLFSNRNSIVNFIIPGIRVND